MLSSSAVIARGHSAGENDHVAFVFEPLRRNVLFIVNQSNHRDCWRRIDDAKRALIIQRNISARDRRSERAASFGHAFNSFTQLPKIFWFVRVAEVQAIRDGQRPRAGAGEVARRLSDSNFAALAWIKCAVE